MSWFKVTLDRKQIGQLEEQRLVSRFFEVMARFNAPPDLALFVQPKAIGELPYPLTLYLPPAAATYCPELLADYGAVPCEKPSHSEAILHMGDGAQSALLD